MVNPSLTAPLYEPATAYHPPLPAPFEFGVDTLSIEDLMETAATREIVIRHASWAGHMYQSEHFKPHRSTFTLRDMAFFIPVDRAQSIADVDAALRQLPRSEWPRHVR
jgi:hypothetical protein